MENGTFFLISFWNSLLLFQEKKVILSVDFTSCSFALFMFYICVCQKLYSFLDTRLCFLFKNDSFFFFIFLQKYCGQNFQYSVEYVEK